MPIQDNDPENYKRPRWDPSLLENEDGDDDIVDDDSDDDDSEEDEDSSSSSDDEEACAERNQRLRTETAQLIRAERIAVEAFRQEEYALREQIRQDTRQIVARTELLREQRHRDIQLLDNIRENARARALEDRAVGRSENPGVPVSFGGHNLPPLVDIGLTDPPRSAAPRGTTGLEDSDVQTAGDHPLGEHITKASVKQADTSTDHYAELSTTNWTDDIVI